MRLLNRRSIPRVCFGLDLSKVRTSNPDSRACMPQLINYFLIGLDFVIVSDLRETVHWGQPDYNRSVTCFLLGGNSSNESEKTLDICREVVKQLMKSDERKNAIANDVPFIMLQWMGRVVPCMMIHQLGLET